MNEILSLLGIANKARKIILGDEIKNNFKKIKLLFIALDISHKSKERYLKKCHYYNVTYIDIYNSEELSKAIGKNIKAIGIIDDGFKDAILKKINLIGGEVYGKTNI